MLGVLVLRVLGARLALSGVFGGLALGFFLAMLGLLGLLTGATLSLGLALGFCLASFLLTALGFLSFLRLATLSLGFLGSSAFLTLGRTLRATLSQALLRGSTKAHQALAQVRALIGKSRQIAAAIGHQGAAEQVTQSHAEPHPQSRVARKAQRLGTHLGEASDAQRAVGNPAQPQGGQRSQQTGQHAQRKRGQQGRKRTERHLQGDPLVQVILTLTQEPPTGNRAGGHRNQQTQQAGASQGLRNRTQDRQHRQGPGIATRQADRGTRAKGETGTGRPGHRVNHQVGQEAQLQQRHSGITHRARVQLLIGGHHLRPPAQNTQGQQQRAQAHKGHRGNHRRAHHSPRVGPGPARVLAHLRNLLRRINTHHARKRTRLAVAAPHQADHHDTQRHQRGVQHLQRLRARARPTVHRRTNQRVGHRAREYRNEELPLVRGARQPATGTVAK